jgi:glycosyltransferase involved in cell wall biosynthesis
VVLPYIQASQSGVIPVAYAFAKPVVTTNVGCLADVVTDRQTGLVIPPGDISALAAAMIQLLSDAVLRNSLGQNAYQKMRDELSWDKIARMTFAVYQSTIPEFESTKRAGKH